MNDLRFFIELLHVAGLRRAALGSRYPSLTTHGLGVIRKACTRRSIVSRKSLSPRISTSSAAILFKRLWLNMCAQHLRDLAHGRIR